jgi:hypothetical protein
LHLVDRRDAAQVIELDVQPMLAQLLDLAEIAGG